MAVLVNELPLIVFEDEHLLVVNKAPGWNTHSPSPYAGQGIYEWLKVREPCWANLAIIHRLDKETSGLLVFSKTRLANQSLTRQFTDGEVRKEYLLRCDHLPRQKKITIKSKLVRIGGRYTSASTGVEAETEFEIFDLKENLILARPKTGRTHQIRVHATENGFPILGDTLYGGSPFQRVCLHAQFIEFKHPFTSKLVNPGHIQFFDIPPWRYRRNFLAPEETNAFRWVNGATDGFPGWHLDQLGANLLSQSAQPLTPPQLELINTWFPNYGLYHKITTPHIRSTQPADVTPKHIQGPTVAAPFTILENGVKFEISFSEGYSTGLFLDQRDNRRRLLREARGEVLNTFAYTCGFSVCAAMAGARATSLDLSRKYLDWGRRNFLLNNLNPAAHDFIYGDVFDWLKRLGKKNRQFDFILLDPPTFSQAKQTGPFRVERDLAKLVVLALPLLKSGGTLFASSNSARWEPEDFLTQIRLAVAQTGRKILSDMYCPQPPDFPISKAEPAYLKTVWLKIS